MNSNSKKIAFASFKKQNEHSSNRKLASMAVNLLIDRVRKANIEIDQIPMQAASQYDLVFVSIMSTIDQINFCRQARKANWHKRNFTVIAGGPGANVAPFPLYDYCDYIYFGQAVNDIAKLAKGNFDSPYILDMKNIKPVQTNIIRTVPNCLKGDIFNGCENKCFYCWYTFHRLPELKKNFSYKNKDFIEVDYANYKYIDLSKEGFISIGLDGLTERNRFFYNRQQSDDDFIEMLSKIATDRKERSATTMKMFNLVGSPVQSESDIDMFKDVLSRASKRIKAKHKLWLKLTSNIIEPKPGTPNQWDGVKPKNCYLMQKPRTYKKYDNLIFDSEKIQAQHSIFNKMPTATIETVAITRNVESIWKAIIYNPKYRRLSRTEQFYALTHHPDYGKVVDRRPIGSELPTDFIHSYSSRQSLELLARRQYRKFEVA